MSRAVAIIFAGAVAIASPAAGAQTRPRGGPAPASGRVARAGTCYTGIAGSLQKEKCVTSAKHSSKLAELDAEPPSPGCSARQQYYLVCRENSRSAGGDESCTEQTTKADCEAVPGGVDPDEPTIDGSDRKCFWFPDRDDSNKGQLCGSARSPHFDDKCVARHNDPSAGTCSGEIDEATKNKMPMHESQSCSDRGIAGGCKFYWDDQMEQKLTGCTWEVRFESWTDVSCGTSDESSAAQNAFASMVGVECENRLKDGCREMGDGRGDGKGCPDFSDETSCLDHGPEDEYCGGTCMLADGDSLHANIASSPSWQGDRSCGDQYSQDSCEYYSPQCSFMNGNQAGCEDAVGCSYDSNTAMCMEGVKPMCHMLSDPDTCTNTAGCTYRSDWSMCTTAMVATGCTWKKQCCQWIPPVGNSNADKEDACSTSGAGTEAGLCEVEYAEPGALPSARIVAMGFEHRLFRLGPDAFSSNAGCAMIATFVNGKGAGVALGADAANLMGRACHTDNVVNSDFCDDDDGAKELELKGVESWMCVAEHIDMTVQEVESYCDSYAGVGNNEAMEAFERYTVHQLIEMANKGTLGDEVSSWEGLKYIVARKDGIDGRCLLIGPKDMSYGVAACTCDSAGCNGQDAIGALIDPANGPMRLFQFLDGSLDSLKDEINAAVPGILGSDGTIDMSKVKDLTPNNIADFMAVAGVSDLTSTEELQGLVNDIKAMADGSNLPIRTITTPPPPPPQVVTGEAGSGEALLSVSVTTDKEELTSDEKGAAIDSAITELVETGHAHSRFIDRSKCSVVKDTSRRRETSWKVHIAFNVDLSDEAVTQLQEAVNTAIEAGTFVISVPGVVITVTSVEVSNDKVPANLKTDGGTGGGTGGVQQQNEEQGTGSATTTTTIAAEESAAVEAVAGVAGAALAVATLLLI